MSQISYGRLFWTFFKINALTFGGGYTIVPIIKDAFADQLEALSEEDMLDLVALAQSGPGAMAISTSLLTGYRLKGPLGAFISLFASILPCILIITAVSIFYVEFRSNPWISAGLVGVGGAVSAILLITTYRMGKKALGPRPMVSLLVMAAAFLLSTFTHVNSGLLILLAGLCGVILFWPRKGGQ